METIRKLEAEMSNLNPDEPIYWYIKGLLDDRNYVLVLIDEVCRKGCPDIANLKKRIIG